MRKIGHLTEPVGLLASRSRSDGHVSGLAYNWRRWLEWCAVNDVQALPASSEDVLVLLHSQRAFWGRHSMRNVADAIAQTHVAHGYPDPTVGRVRLYLASAFRALAGRGERHAIDPVRGHVAMELCAAPTTASPRLQVSGARQVLALTAVRDHGLTFTQIADAAVLAISATVTGLVVSDGQTVELSGPLAPEAFAAARQLQEHGVTDLTSSRLLRCGLNTTIARAGRADLTVDDLTTWSDDDVAWVLNWTDATFAGDLRNRSAVLTGIALAARAISIGAFDIEDFASEDDGYGRDVVFRRSKGDQAGQGLPHHIGHSHDPGDQDPDPWCPACSLTAWLWVLEARWGLTTGPLFPRLTTPVNGTPTGRLTTPQLRRIVQQVWHHGGGDPLARIASRSLRVGGATSAHEAGFTIDEIHDLLLHRTPAHTPRYIRGAQGPDALIHLDV